MVTLSGLSSALIGERSVSDQPPPWLPAWLLAFVIVKASFCDCASVRARMTETRSLKPFVILPLAMLPAGLPRIHLLRRDEAGDLVRVRDCAGNDGGTGHDLVRDHSVRDGVRAGGPGGDVTGGDEHGDVLLATLHVTLVARHVKPRQERCKSCQRHCDDDIAGTFCHGR